MFIVFLLSSSLVEEKAQSKKQTITDNNEVNSKNEGVTIKTTPSERCVCVCALLYVFC